MRREIKAYSGVAEDNLTISAGLTSKMENEHFRYIFSVTSNILSTDTVYKKFENDVPEGILF